MFDAFLLSTKIIQRPTLPAAIINQDYFICVVAL